MFARTLLYKYKVKNAQHTLCVFIVSVLFSAQGSHKAEKAVTDHAPKGVENKVIHITAAHGKRKLDDLNGKRDQKARQHGLFEAV